MNPLLRKPFYPILMKLLNRFWIPFFKLFLERAFMLKPLPQLVLFSLVITSYSFLLYAQYTMKQFQLLPYHFKKLTSTSCSAPVLTKGYLNSNELDLTCQLSKPNFYKLSLLLNLKINNLDIQILFNTLDISGNGFLSIGELQTDYFNVGVGALEFYTARYYYLKKSKFDAGLKRIEIDYTPFALADPS